VRLVMVSPNLGRTMPYTKRSGPIAFHQWSDKLF
jgi:hypothetical protein